MSHHGVASKPTDSRFRLDMSKVNPGFDSRPPLNHSQSFSKDVVGSKAYAEAMKALQRKIKAVEAERDEARDTVSRLEKRMVGGKDAWEQRLRESERSAQEMESKLRDTVSLLEVSAQSQTSLMEKNKAARGMKESLQLATAELQQAKVESRERAARCAELEVKNKGLLKLNADLQYRCSQLEQALAEQEQGISPATVQELSLKIDQLQKANDVLAQKLQYQQELSSTQKEHIAYLSEQLRDLHRLYSAEASRVVSMPHSPHGEPKRTKVSRSASLNASFAATNSKKLLKEIRRYQKERNALETSGRLDRDGKVELQALRKLIAAKSSQLKHTR